MKFLVLAKQVPDSGEPRKLNPETGILDRKATEAMPDEITERALECALRIKDTGDSTEVVVLTVGPADAEKSIRRLLAMGADRAVHVVDDSLAGSDMLQTARVLATAAAKEGFDVLLTGDQSTDGRGGLVPSMVAELLNLPVLPDLEYVEVSDNAVQGMLKTSDTEIQLEAPVPAVVAVTERAAEIRFPNFKGIRAAKKKPVDVISLTDVGIQAGPTVATSQSVMVSATTAPAKTGGTKIVDDGTAAEQLAAFLESKRLL